MSIPLSRNAGDDIWFWHWDKKGSYTVKSGYRSLMARYEQNAPSSLVNWNVHWDLQVLPKVKNSIWRSLSSCLPTMKSLRYRHVDVNEWCPLCHNGVEDELHALVSCPVVRCMWRSSPIGDFLGQAVSLEEWWEAMIQRVAKDEACASAIIMWNIWKIRNDLVWNGNHKPASIVINIAMDMLQQWKSASRVSEKLPVAATMVEKWSKPDTGRLKCNVDAALISARPWSWFGCVVLGSAGEVVAAMHGCIPGQHTPLMEAMGVREALSWLKGLGLKDIIIESDSLSLINALQCTKSNSSYFGLLIMDCNLLAKEFLKCDFVFVRRSANQVAHCLARTVDSMSSLVSWVGSFPAFISRVLAADIS